MGEIVLCPESVDAYKQLMTNPKKHGLDLPGLNECFEEAPEATAKHILYDQYLKKINKNRDAMPKVFFYIVMDELYCKTIALAADGNLGYKLKIKDEATDIKN